MKLQLRPILLIFLGHLSTEFVQVFGSWQKVPYAVKYDKGYKPPSIPAISPVSVPSSSPSLFQSRSGYAATSDIIPIVIPSYYGRDGLATESFSFPNVFNSYPSSYFDDNHGSSSGFGGNEWNSGTLSGSAATVIMLGGGSGNGNKYQKKPEIIQIQEDSKHEVKPHHKIRVVKQSSYSKHEKPGFVQLRILFYCMIA